MQRDVSKRSLATELPIRSATEHCEVDSKNKKPEIPWFQVPADLQSAREHGAELSIDHYGTKNGQHLTWRSTAEEFSKVSAAYELYFELLSLLNRLWVLLLIQTLLTEIVSGIWCWRSDDPAYYAIISFSFRCEEGELSVPFKTKILVCCLYICVTHFMICNKKFELVKQAEIRRRDDPFSENEFCILVQSLPQNHTADDLKSYFQEADWFSEPLKSQEHHLVA